MSDIIDFPIGASERFVTPPILDYLFVDGGHRRYVVTFIPPDSVSTREKEVVEIPEDAPEGKRIQLRLQHIALLIGGGVDRVFHAGGGDFGFYRTDGRLFQMSKNSPSPAATQELYGHLQDLACVAEIAFLDTKAPASKTA